MRLSSNATTPQELREEIVNLLLHRATQHEDLAKAHHLGSQAAALRLNAARTLQNLAEDVKCMELTKFHSGFQHSAPSDYDSDGLRITEVATASDGSPRVLDAATKGRQEWKGGE